MSKHYSHTFQSFGSKRNPTTPDDANRERFLNRDTGHTNNKVPEGLELSALGEWLRDKYHQLMHLLTADTNQ